MTVRVKICGLTNLEDALVAAAAGADYLGFIFYPPSKRTVTAETARPLIAQLRQSLTAVERPPRLVGVFVNEMPQVVSSVLSTCDLDLAQLSGDEPASDISADDSPLAQRAYRSIRPTTPDEALALAAAHTPAANLAAPGGPDLLLDTYHPQLRGGTGHVTDWYVAHTLARQSRLMLAGGLTAQNVAEAIRIVQPFAVDVASGVEASPGRKDHNAVRTFVQLAREAIGND